MTMLERAARAIFETWAAHTKADGTWDEALRAHAAGEEQYPAAYAHVELARAEARAVLRLFEEPDVAEAMARAHDREQAAQIGEPSPWDEEGDDFQEFRADRICAMQCAIDAILEGESK